jgi:hypothetical protein
MPSTLTAAYRISDGEVRLRVAVGNGQAGWTSAMIGPKFVGEGKELNVTLGNGLDLVGRVVICSTTIRDVQPTTNHAGVTYFFSGGRQPKMWQLNELLEEDTTMVFHAIFTFIE